MSELLSRRRFIVFAAAAGIPAVARAQTRSDSITQTMFGPMDQTAYHPVRLPPKIGGRAQLTQRQRDAVEHDLKCQCGCTLDVYTCRTTDFTCPVSPAMHADVVALVAGGYGAEEIRDAFRSVYGEQVLMAPVRAGFNWVGYVLPFVVLAGGVSVATWLARRWSARSRTPVAASAVAEKHDITPEELSRIDAAVHRDE